MSDATLTHEQFLTTLNRVGSSSAEISSAARANMMDHDRLQRAEIARLRAVEEAAWEVWNTVPAVISGLPVERHARALNALRDALAAHPAARGKEREA